MLKKLALSAIAVLVTLLIVAHWIVALPSRVTIINRAAHSLRNVVVAAGGKDIPLGGLGPGESRSLTVPSGGTIILEFEGQHVRRWISPKPIVPGQSFVLYITDQERIELNGNR